MTSPGACPNIGSRHAAFGHLPCAFHYHSHTIVQHIYSRHEHGSPSSACVSGFTITAVLAMGTTLHHPAACTFHHHSRTPLPHIRDDHFSSCVRVCVAFRLHNHRCSSHGHCRPPDWCRHHPWPQEPGRHSLKTPPFTALEPPLQPAASVPVVLPQRVSDSRH